MDVAITLREEIIYINRILVTKQDHESLGISNSVICHKNVENQLDTNYIWNRDSTIHPQPRI